MKSNFQKISANEWVSELASKGQYSLSSQLAREKLGISADASKLALNKLVKKGVIASPARGFYVIVPPEYQALGCLPAEQFIPALMNHKKLNYYTGLLSAAQFHGAAHQRPQEFQVLVPKPLREISCGQVRVKFITRKDLDSIPFTLVNTPRGELRISTPEATALDLTGFPHHSGGLNNVAMIIQELAEKIDPSKILELTDSYPMPWIQRLGYLIELGNAPVATSTLRDYVKENAREYTRLSTGIDDESGIKHPTWKVVENTKLELDL